MRAYIRDRYRAGKVPTHIWLGVSVEDAKHTSRIEHLKQVNSEGTHPVTAAAWGDQAAWARVVVRQFQGRRSPICLAGSGSLANTSASQARGSVSLSLAVSISV